MYDYFYRFGLGQKSGIGFPGEGTGIVTKPARLERVAALHVCSARACRSTRSRRPRSSRPSPTTACAGPPAAGRSVGDGNADGTYVAAPAPKGVRVVSPEIAKQVREMLEGVVGKEGTAPEARIEGYRVAGKTGTADRYDDKTGGYSGKTASFIGFAPADNPQVLVSGDPAATGQGLLRRRGRRSGVPTTS